MTQSTRSSAHAEPDAIAGTVLDISAEQRGSPARVGSGPSVVSNATDQVAESQLRTFSEVMVAVRAFRRNSSKT